MSKALTYSDIVRKTAKIGIEGMEGARVSNVGFYPKTKHYDCTVSVDSHVVKGANQNYDSLTVMGHRLEDLMDLMEGLGFGLGMIRQFDRIDRESDDVLARGIEISFHLSD
jgi:hypothetical protein